MKKLICKAGADYATRTKLKYRTTALNIALTSQYKNGDYVMLVRTPVDTA